MKKLIPIIVCLCLSLSSFGQSAEQNAVFNHYHLFPILVSPAAAGFNDAHQLQMNVRTQWTGFNGSPKTYSIGYNGPVGKTFGVGAGLLSEDIGPTTRLRFQMNFALRMQVRDLKIAGGFSTEFHNFKLANSVLDNGFYDTGDQVIEDAIDGNRIFDASMGVWSTYKDQTHIGLTFGNLIVAKIGQIESGDPEGSFFKFVIFNLGHEFEVEEYNFKLEPSMMIRRLQDTPLQVDFNMKGAFLDEKLVAGLSYHAGVGGAVGLLLGTKVSSFQLYYSYDVAFSGFQQYNSGSHEVTIAFDFLPGKKKYDHGR